jgi:hypothetical protein
MKTYVIEVRFDINVEGVPTEQEMRDFIKDLFIDACSTTSATSTMYFNKENCDIQLELW